MPAPTGSFDAPNLSAPELALSFRVSPDLTATGEPAAWLSWGLLPYSVCGSGSPVSSGLPHPTSSVFRVPVPPDGLLPPEPSGLISSRNALGVLPSGLFPLAEPLHPLECRCLPDVGLGFTQVTELQLERPGSTEASPPRSCSLRGSATQPCWLSPVRPSRCPPGFLTSRGFPSAAARSSRCGSPLELRHVLAQAAPAFMTMTALQGLDHLGVADLFRGCIPFWSSCTFSPSRR